MNVINLIYFVNLLIILSLPYSRNAALSIYEQKKYKNMLEGQGLYGPDDDVEILTVHNFRTSITNSPQAWIVEFYNSWCGFCQRFAPSWKALGTDIKGWSNMIRLGAIDCSVDENFQICREYEIMGYPTLRYFHEHFQPATGNFGIDVRKGEDMDNHRKFLIDTMVNEQIEHRGQIYPNLLPFNGSHVVNFFDGQPANIQFGIFIVESPTSYLGKEVALDLHDTTNIIIRNVWNNSTDLVNYFDLKTFPSVVIVRRSNNEKHTLTGTLTTRKGIKEAIRNFLETQHITVITEPSKNKEIYTGKWLDAEAADMNTVIRAMARKALLERAKEMGDAVFYMDLETALRYSLKHEVGSVKTITGEKLEALRKYLKALQKYFPFGYAGKQFLNNLVTIVDSDNVIAGDKLAKIFEDAEEPSSLIYSSPLTWLGCEGSAPNFRRYPCGLWKLFHFLTVNAAEYNNNNYNKNSNPREILETMHAYIKNYFGCADCSRHFQEMAARLDLRNVSSHDSSVIWLWVAHNEVNKRLAGDKTEDPAFPKIQFPIKERCPDCRFSDDNWNLGQVLRYVKHMYSNSNIKYLGSNTSVLHIGLEGEATTSGSSSVFQALDISMFFVLYFISFILLVLLIRIFLKRGYRKKPYIHDLLGKV